MLKRFLYFGYYLKEIDLSRLRRFIRHAKASSGRSTLNLMQDVMTSSIRYNISILDYFYFRFYNLTPAERSSYAGTGFMYEYQLKMNPKNSRSVLNDKILFLKTYLKFVRRKFASLEDVRLSPHTFDSLKNNTTGKLVLKGSHGQVGAEVMVVDSRMLSFDDLLAVMEKNNFDLIEEYVVQHPLLMKLSPSGLNTVRVITQLSEGKVIFVAARLRISINSSVDNMAAGNVAAPIDLDTGSINGAAVYSDITKNEITHHPITGVTISNFQVPYWKETLQLVKEAALLVPENRSIGWDVAISEVGPQLIEGNHNWCKLLWQLPEKKGMKKTLVEFL